MRSYRVRRTALALGILLAVVASGVVGAQESMTVVVTHYADTGVTYSGSYTRPGVAACSWNLPLGTLVRFQDGREYRCEDRGQLGDVGWLDLWVGDVALARQLGRYTATVEVIRP